MDKEDLQSLLDMEWRNYLKHKRKVNRFTFESVAEESPQDAMPEKDLKQLTKKWKKNYKEKKLGKNSKTFGLISNFRLQDQLDIIEAINSGNFIVEE